MNGRDTSSSKSIPDERSTFQGRTFISPEGAGHSDTHSNTAANGVQPRRVTVRDAFSQLTPTEVNQITEEFGVCKSHDMPDGVESKTRQQVEHPVLRSTNLI